MAFTRTYDGDAPVRINKWLGQAGVCSRREAESLIADGLVSIDGEVISFFLAGLYIPYLL